MKHFYRLILIAPAVLFPYPARAYQSFLATMASSPASDVYFKILSLSISLVIAAMVLMVAGKASGKLKTAWIYFFLAAVMFVILHLTGLLEALDVIDVSLFFFFLEFLMLVFLLLGVMTFRKLLNTIIKTKSFTHDIKEED